MLKAALPTLAFKLLFPSQPYFLVAALAEMAGHNWPVFHRFKGGRGVSSVYGSLLVIDAIGAFAVAFGGMVLGLVIIKDFIVAYLGGLWLLIPWLWWRTGDPAYVAYAIGANILFVLGMIPDLKQYMRFKGQGKADLRTVANTTPMGRGMMKMMEMLHLVRKED
jgi:glycerol-3-phosphate acyltransferase PlsY